MFLNKLKKSMLILIFETRQMIYPSFEIIDS